MTEAFKKILECRLQALQVQALQTQALQSQGSQNQWQAILQYFPMNTKTVTTTSTFRSSDPPSPAPAAFPKALLAGPIVAYRLWKIVRDATKDIWLKSVTQAQAWPFGQPLAAVCRGGITGVPPHPGCACGIYASKTIPDLDTYMDHTLVIGTVGLWGRVIEHDLGYRAQYAYPVALAVRRLSVPPGFPRSEIRDRALMALQANYGCPVVELEQLTPAGRREAIP